MLRDIPTERISSLKKRLSDLRAQIDQSNSEFPNKNPSLRLSKEIELLEIGCDVKNDRHGLLVNDKYIIGITNNRWCIKGQYNWYWYKDLKNFVKKHINNEIFT